MIEHPNRHEPIRRFRAMDVSTRTSNDSSHAGGAITGMGPKPANTGRTDRDGDGNPPPRTPDETGTGSQGNGNRHAVRPRTRARNEQERPMKDRNENPLPQPLMADGEW